MTFYKSLKLFIKNYHYIILVFSSLLLAFLVLGISFSDLSLPFTYRYDEILHNFFCKTLIDNTWYNVNNFTGMPGKTDLSNFPIGTDSFHLLLIKILSFFITDNFLLINLFFLLTFPLTSITTFYALRQLKLEHNIAMVIALLFTFIPYHFYRGTEHLFLGGYYIIPLGIIIIIWLLETPALIFKKEKKAKWLLIKSKKTLLVIFFSIIIAGGNVYYAFYLMLLIGLGAVFISLQTKSYIPLLNALLIILIIGFIALLNISPYIYNIITVGKNEYVANRQFIESDLYSLRLIQLILPVENHRISGLAELTNNYNQNAFLLNENKWTSLGFISSIGLFISIFICVLGYKLKGNDLFNKKIHLFSSLSIFALIWGSFGGLATIFSFFINASIRSNNRLSIFIALFSLIIIGLLLEKILSKIKKAYLRHFILIAVLAVGIFDQTTNDFKVNHENILYEFNSDKKFISNIENTEPNTSMIFQLPYFKFPEGSENSIGYKMHDYDLFKGYLHSKKGTKWSFGAVKGSDTDKWIETVSSQDPNRLLTNIKEKGFTGLYIDCFGYADNGIEIEHQFTNILGPPIVSDSKRLLYYSLKNHQTKPISDFNIDFEKDTININFGIGGNCPAYINLSQWHQSENNFRWSRGNNAVLTFDPIISKTDINLELFIRPLINNQIPSQLIKIKFNNKQIEELKISTSGKYIVPISSKHLNTEKNNTLEFEFPYATSPKKLGINNDERIIAIGFEVINLIKK